MGALIQADRTVAVRIAWNREYKEYRVHETQASGQVDTYYTCDLQDALDTAGVISATCGFAVTMDATTARRMNRKAVADVAARRQGGR